MEPNFNPYNPNSKYNEAYYLDGLDNLEVDMQMKNIPIKLWTQRVAEEIYGELNNRTKIRTKAKLLMEKKFEYLQMSRSQQKANQFDEFSYQQKRIEYWNYVRSTSQLYSFQIKAIDQILSYKQYQIEELCKKFKNRSINNDMCYLKVAEAEKPIERQLQVNLNLGQIVRCLDEKRMFLQEKLESKELVGYEQKNDLDILHGENKIEHESSSNNESENDDLFDKDKEDYQFELDQIPDKVIQIGGNVGEINMNILAKQPTNALMDPIREEFRMTLD